MEISQSKIKTWRTCRKQYFYKYILKLEKKRKPYAFLRGTFVHEMLEAIYNQKSPWPVYDKLIEENERAFRIHPEEYGTMPEDVKLLVKGYNRFYKDEDLKVHKVEHEFKVPLIKGVDLVGKIDMIAANQKLNWVVEHKCHNKIPDNSLVPYSNLQSALYAWAWNTQNPKLKADGIMWNYLWGKPMGIPQFLKNGTMSKKVTQNMTWPSYKAHLKLNNLKPNNYLDMKEKLSENMSNFYQRKFVPLNATLIDNIVKDTKFTAKEILENSEKDQTRNLGHHCDFCQFKELCQAQLKGLDDNFILKSDFRKRKKDELQDNPQQD